MSIFKRSFRCPFILPHIPLPRTPSRTKSCLLPPSPHCPPQKKNGYVGLKPKCLYFANYTLQNEFFWQKMTFLKEILHFLVELFGCIKKKSYLCMLFRGEASLARVYTGTRSLFRAGRRAGGKLGNI